MNIDMTEAVEAAARVIEQSHWRGTECGDPESMSACVNCFGGSGMTDAEVAQAAITAALPILRAQFAEEVATAIEKEDRRMAGIEQETRSWTVNDHWNGFRKGVERAAAIARNWGAK